MLTRTIASFVSETPADSLSTETRHAARRALTDSMGVMLGGSDHEAVHLTLQVAEATGVSGTSTIVASERTTDVLTAALVNGVMAHVLDFDDTLLPTRLHPSAVLVPALLAVAESRDLPAAAIVDALPFGFEVQARLATATYPSFGERGWHGTGIYGGIGAAVAVGRCLSLDTDRMAAAIGLAATGGAGIVHVFGSEAKSLNLGRAAMTGLHSALLAEVGFTCTDVLRDDGGFLRLYDDEPRTAALVDGLGEDWTIEVNGFKPYPCGVVGHAAIDGVLALRDELPGATIRRMTLTVSPETERLMGDLHPTTGLAAKFSVRFAAAAAWLRGELRADAFTDDIVGSEAVATTMAAIPVVVDPAMPQASAVIELETTDGRVATHRVEHARGTTGRPMTDADLEAKFRSLVPVGADADQLLATLAAVDTIPAREFAGAFAAR